MLYMYSDILGSGSHPEFDFIDTLTVVNSSPVVHLFVYICIYVYIYKYILYIRN